MNTQNQVWKKLNSHNAKSLFIDVKTEPKNVIIIKNDYISYPDTWMMFSATVSQDPIELKANTETEAKVESMQLYANANS